MIIKQLFSKPFLLSPQFNLFISVNKTPNPNFLKFLPGQIIMDSGTIDFPSPKYTTISPLARKLFQIKGINRVFYGPDYISISKTQQSDWTILKPQIFALLSQHFQKGEKLLIDQNQLPDDTKIIQTDSEAVQLIKEIIATRIRPMIHQDGGDIRYIQFNQEQGIVYLQMMGSCSGCPSSLSTLKNGIQKMLRHYVGQVKKVESIEYNQNQ